MTDRILDIAERPARLRIKDALLVIETPGGPDQTVPVGELGAVIISHPQVSYTQAVLAEFAAAGTVFVACDARHLPIGMMLPLAPHYAMTQRFAAQAAVARPTAKRVWQQIVRAKITGQARVLKQLRGHDHGLPELARQVRSGDPGNIEAQASRRYWPALFSEQFRRRREGIDENRLLNYGYAVLRGIVARAICGCGLHPCLGIHHHNRYNPFCLADDLMEPLRPAVDRTVARLADESIDIDLDRQSKEAILKGLSGRYRMDDEDRTLFDIASRMASSLNGVFAGERQRLAIAELWRDG